MRNLEGWLDNGRDRNICPDFTYTPRKLDVTVSSVCLVLCQTITSNPDNASHLSDPHSGLNAKEGFRAMGPHTAQPMLVEAEPLNTLRRIY